MNLRYPPSKLPLVGTTIFTVMSALAEQHQAINLSQGFPDFEVDPELRNRVTHHLESGHNQYAPMPGLPALRHEIARNMQLWYGHAFDPVAEVTVTSGATEAIFSTIAALIHPGDEVIVIEPAYDCYLPAISLAGGKAVIIERTFPYYNVDWEAVGRCITPATKAILLNSPNNPSGAIWAPEDLDALHSLVKGTDLLLISDEVYEHMVFDGKSHLSIARYPELLPRTVIISSFGKTFHATGWKIGYLLAPPQLTHEIRKVHQYVTFSTSTPFQWALADHLASNPASIAGLSAFYQEKRDRFLELMAGSRFVPITSAGSYFQLMRYDAISNLPDREFATWLTQTAGVAAIPVSSFYENGVDNRVVRFCFAKSEATLTEAARRLKQV